MEWAEGHPCRLSQPPSLTAPGRFCFTDWNHYALVLYSVTSLKLRSSLSVIRNYTCPLILANWWEGLSEDIIRGGGARASPLTSQKEAGVQASSQDRRSRRCLARDDDGRLVCSATPSRGEVTPTRAALPVSSWPSPGASRNVCRHTAGGGSPEWAGEGQNQLHFHRS